MVDDTDDDWTTASSARLNFLAQGKAWAETWMRAADDAVGRLYAAEQVNDNDGALIAAHEMLGAIDRLVGWARALEPVCDDAFRRQLERFRSGHPNLRAARNVHEHLDGYLREQRHKLSDPRLTGEVVYEFDDDDSFIVRMITTDDHTERVEVRLTDAVADATVLTWETIKAADRAMLALFSRPGEPSADFGYLHDIEADDGSFYFSDEPPAGYDPA